MHHFLRLDWGGKIAVGILELENFGVEVGICFIGLFWMLGYWNNGILMLIKRTFSRRDWS